MRSRPLLCLMVIGALAAPITAQARQPVGKAALDAIAPLDGSIQRARLGLMGVTFEEVQAGRLLSFVGPDITVGTCDGRVYAVTRMLGDMAADGLNAVMLITSIAGAPRSRQVKAFGTPGAQDLQFYWDAIPEYHIDVIRTDVSWSASESTERQDTCKGI